MLAVGTVVVTSLVSAGFAISSLGNVVLPDGSILGA